MEILPTGVSTAKGFFDVSGDVPNLLPHKMCTLLQIHDYAQDARRANFTGSRDRRRQR
jgi:hypothetical protein